MWKENRKLEKVCLRLFDCVDFEGIFAGCDVVFGFGPSFG